MQVALGLSMLVNFGVLAALVAVVASPENRLRVAAWLKATAHEGLALRKEAERLRTRRIEQQRDLEKEFLSQAANGFTYQRPEGYTGI